MAKGYAFTYRQVSCNLVWKAVLWHEGHNTESPHGWIAALICKEGTWNSFVDYFLSDWVKMTKEKAVIDK